MKHNDITILFLAKYAPSSVNQEIPSGIPDRVYAEYHHRIYHVLKENFHSVISSQNPAKLINLETEVDYVFSLFNKFPMRNSEIFISALAEYYKIAYLGATPNIRALAEDKHLAKMLSKHAEVPTAKWEIYNINDPLSCPNFAPPYFVKPRFGAASADISEDSICQSWNQAIIQIMKLHSKKIDAILEQQIKGIYFTCPVLNNFNEPIFLSPIKECSILKDNVVTYEQKRKIIGGLERTVSVDKLLNNQLTAYSKKLFTAIQPLDYTRFDFIVDENTGIPYFLEFNVCCNLGEQSTLAQSALNQGLKYEDLLLNILYSSFYRQGLVSDTFGKKL